MLAKLRREFVAITMVLVGLVLLGVLGSSFASSAVTQRDLTRQALERALEGDVSGVRFGDSTGQDGPDVMLTVTLNVYWDGSAEKVSDSLLDIGDDTLEDVLNEVMASSDPLGESSTYPISWLRADAPWGWRVALADTYSRDATLRAQAKNDIVIFAASMGVVFVMAYLFSGWALKPVAKAWERQRRFVSDASHELKTPLAVILANTQILEGDQTLPDEARRWVDSTSDEAKHLQGLVEDLLTLARADEQEASGATSPTTRPGVDVTGLVSGCGLEFDAVAFERGCSIECDLAEGVTATADPDQLRRVVRTLLDNATKYADAGTAVTVRLVRDGRRARLTVNNRGEVISPDALEHLFDRFYRTDGARERQKTGGFGLGLAIAKSLVEAMGGKISAASSERDGTTFTVTL